MIEMFPAADAAKFFNCLKSSLSMPDPFKSLQF